MAKTNFQIFNEENTPERTYNDSEYKEATQRVGGVMPGMALSRMHNKMYYQWSAMCKAIANLIVNHGHDCMDSDVEGITNHLEEAIASAATGILDEHRTKTPMDHPPKSVTGDHIADGVIEKKHLTAAMMSVISDAGIAILGRNKTYAVGDIAYHKSLPSWARLECVSAGTTGAELPDKIKQTTENGGVIIHDGTVVWIIDDLRDGTPVGAVRGSLYLPPGYIKANGATVQRADYPRLVALAERYHLWTDDTAANAGLFGSGDGSATMVLPNWTGMFVRFVDGIRTAGSYESDAVQDHGHELMECYNTPLLYSSNAVTGGNAPNNLVSGKATPVQGITPTHKHPNPRIADETRPKNIGYIPIIRY
jgi:hypothetical protein